MTAKVCSDSEEVGFEVIMCLCAAQVVLLVCHGVHRGEGGDRIVVEVVTQDETSGTFLVSGLSRVQSGLSFPVPMRGLWRQQLLVVVGLWRLGHP